MSTPTPINKRKCKNFNLKEPCNSKAIYVHINFQVPLLSAKTIKTHIRHIRYHNSKTTFIHIDQTE